ncbi:MAG: 23S rRNA (adenine(2503)-C(2))-methyltransferase RlmN [Dehalococcoidia bacterium]|nr:23S rRNA (adenine(2503)-C(2))-methyltransferase RlmN [Dehalococcoidia bacterium]
MTNRLALTQKPHVAAQPLLGLNTDELTSLALSHGQPALRGAQLAKWLYTRPVTSFTAMTDISKAFAAELAAVYTLGRSTVAVSQPSQDGSVKMLLQLHDGQRVETVGLPYEDRTSCCVSSQVGCPVRCAFCATGRSGYTRNLTPGEIVDQVLTVQNALRERLGPDQRVSNIVFMGMGEPLLNYDNVLKATHLLNKEVGIAMEKMTVSTVGYVPSIRKLAQDNPRVTLAVSLHAPNDMLRRRLIPTMQQWTVQEIAAAAGDYAAVTNRRVTFEYCLLRGENDSLECAEELARLMNGVFAHVNLIPYNTVEGLGYYAPLPEQVYAFKETLERAGVHVTQRVQRGADIDAACGQLRRRQEHPA